MESSLVSIITPVYNGERYLDRSITSVLNQNYSNWEMILIDDCSGDNSIEVIRQYLSDKRIRLIKNTINQGISSTRNTGISKAKGEYIALLDQDDEWLPNKLEEQTFLMRNSEYGLTYTNLKIVLNNGKIIPRRKDIHPASEVYSNLERVFLSNLISSPTVLVKKSVLNEVGVFNEEIKWGGDDYDLWIRIAQKYKFGFIDKVLAIRYEHGKNYSLDKKKMMIGTLELSKFYQKEFSLPKELLIKQIAMQYYWYSLEAMKSNDVLEGIKYLLKSIKTHRVSLKLLSKTIKNFLKPSNSNISSNDTR